MEHPITDETMMKFDSKPTLLEKLRVLLGEANTPEVLYDKVEQKTETIDGIALVQCFYGNDISRISATTQALEFNLQMTRKPSTWVFVEAQKSKSECVFNWVKKYGIRHIFVKTTSNSDGILLKNPLWNIGVENCVEDRLCFLDSDVVMCNSDWVEKCRDAFDSGLDVLSLASHQYCQADDSCSLHESIGYRWAVKRTVENSHCGFTIGMTKKAWQEIGKFKPALILDDLRTFHTLMGQSTFAPFKKWTSSFKLDNPHALGYNLSLGYANNIACHVWHGDPGGKYEAITRLLNAAGVKDIDSLIEDGGNGIPVWKSGLASVDAIRKLLQNNIEDNQDISGSYYQEMRNRLGTPDEKHPLFVCTIVKDCFGLEFKDFVDFKNKIESEYNPGHGINPTVVFLTDNNRFKESFKEADLNVLPIDKKILSGKSRNHSIVEMCADAIGSIEKEKWKGSTVMYVPFDFKDFDKLELDVWVPDGVVKMVDGVEMVVV